MRGARGQRPYDSDGMDERCTQACASTASTRTRASTCGSGEMLIGGVGASARPSAAGGSNLQVQFRPDRTVTGPSWSSTAASWCSAPVEFYEGPDAAKSRPREAGAPTLPTCDPPRPHRPGTLPSGGAPLTSAAHSRATVS
jgi:hypothetical protein